MISELGRRPVLGSHENSFGNELEKEIGLLLREQHREEFDDLEKELNIYRSGSAPPTVEGSLSAVGGLFGYGVSAGTGFSEFAPGNARNEFKSEEELRSDPAYVHYYYSNVNLNPRLPPPLLSKEDWRFAKRLQGGSSAIGDRRKVNPNESGGTRSLHAMPPGFSSKKPEIDSGSDQLQGSGEWGGDGLIGLPGLGLGSKQNSLAENFQDDLSRTTSASKLPSRPASRNALSQIIDDLGYAEADAASLHADLTNNGPLRSSSNIMSSSAAQLQPVSYSYAAALGGSLSRSTTPDPQGIARAPSPGLAPIGGGRAGNADKRNFTSPNSSNGLSSLTNDPAELAAALSGMSLANGVGHTESRFPSGIDQDIDDQNSYLFNLSGSQSNSKQHSYVKSNSGASSSNMPLPDMNSALQADHRKATVRNNSYKKVSSDLMVNVAGGLASQYQHLDSPNSLLSSYNLSGYSINPSNMPPLFENAAAASAMGLPGMDARMLGMSNMGSPVTDQNLRMGNQMSASGLQSHYMDQGYLQYLSAADYLASQVAALNDLSVDRSYMGNLYAELLQKPYLGSMLSPQSPAFGVPGGIKHAHSNHPGFYSNPAYGLSYPGSPLASPLVPNSPPGLGSPMRHADFSMKYASGMKNTAGGVLGPWNLDNLHKSFGSTLLEEFKSNKTKCFELSEITGHVVEFSADQYGSRFIQQKLETATTEEKHMVFDEINPHALTLMTDVFGNYVIQKIFEHGMASQRRELARKLLGNVLTMSLQMYGCRVIQKAIEVVDEDQKIQMVKELDGHVMRCVRDQNGNHVIQKCIECVPEEHVQFIVSTFFGQVVTLSSHPYGCRVIQRVLEHCSNPETQSKVMEEILGSVSMLAQDQYGNYVIQHVLEHGKPHERSTIIKELADKIVQMSQQKFASNVVEKCLTFGDSSERQLLVKEMLGTTDENEPLQAMMKDQFANYVVQKVLETCSDQQREWILSRIKVHLNALKKYTYGKHIVARVEKLVAAGERRIAASQSAQCLNER